MLTVFNLEQLDLLRSLPEVVEAQERLSTRDVVSFDAVVPDSIKETLVSQWGLSLGDRIPFRWIRGNTRPHVDRGASSFDRTHLVYLTDGEGEFRIGDESYPIVAGSGFSFSEGTRHEVTGAEESTRLLLGPMSEAGSPVGEVGTAINADGSTTTIYIQQVEGVSQYRLNNGDWTSFLWPAFIGNTNESPASNILKVLFTTNITFDSSSGYIQPTSDGIQIGDTTLRSDGTKTIITIDAVESYTGFVNLFAYSNVYVYNIHVAATNGSTLNEYYGWVGQLGYGKDGSNNYVIGCSSDGDIPQNSGGILGSEAGGTDEEDQSSLTIIGCTSSGSIGTDAGGIVAIQCASGDGASLTISKCSSSGTIAQGGGGITGKYAGESSGTCTVTQCYSTGTIGTDAGGIFGTNAGNFGTAIATDCYSRGNIGTDAGGIFGLGAASSSGSTIATGCYSSGTITTEGNGIYGTGKDVGGISSTSYSANGSWNDSSAVIAGLDLSVYISIATNQPFELREIGPSPYSLTTIVNNDIVTAVAQSVNQGLSSTAGVVSGYSTFSILSGGNESITINETTGVISTAFTTETGTYPLVVRSVTNPYSITVFVLTVTTGPFGGSSASSLVPRVRVGSASAFTQVLKANANNLPDPTKKSASFVAPRRNVIGPLARASGVSPDVLAIPQWTSLQFNGRFFVR